MAPFDPSVLLTQGPLGVLVAFLVWLWGKERDEKNKLVEAHKVEIAAKDARIMQITDERFEDQKVLIPIASSATTALQQTSNLIARMADK